jgi:hypothetical protein
VLQFHGENKKTITAATAETQRSCWSLGLRNTQPRHPLACGAPALAAKIPEALPEIGDGVAFDLPALFLKRHRAERAPKLAWNRNECFALSRLLENCSQTEPTV